MYTPNQVSEMLSIPASTIRRYATTYKDHLSFKHLKGRKREYTDQDIIILAKVRDLSNDGLNHNQIKDQLQLVDPQETNPIDKSLVLIPSIAKQLQAFQDYQTSTNNQIEMLSKKIKDLENYINLPWYKKILNKYK